MNYKVLSEEKLCQAGQKRQQSGNKHIVHFGIRKNFISKLSIKCS